MHAGAYGSDKNFGFGWSLSVPPRPCQISPGLAAGYAAIASFSFLCAVVQADTLTLDQAACRPLWNQYPTSGTAHCLAIYERGCRDRGIGL